jgi:hypothetical protein
MAVEQRTGEASIRLLSEKERWVSRSVATSPIVVERAHAERYLHQCVSRADAADPHPHVEGDAVHVRVPPVRAGGLRALAPWPYRGIGTTEALESVHRLFASQRSAVSTGSSTSTTRPGGMRQVARRRAALAGVSGREELMDAVHAGGLGGTFGGNPQSRAAALAALDRLDDPAFLTRARELGDPLVATDEDVDLGLAVLESVLGEVAQGR